MQLMWFLIISCFAITNCFGQFQGSSGPSGTRFGGNSISPPPISYSTLYKPLNTPYYHANPVYTSNIPPHTTFQVTPGANTYNTLHVPQAASAPTLSVLHGLQSPGQQPAVQTWNTMHVPLAASAPHLSTFSGQPIYVIGSTPKPLSTQNNRGIPTSVPQMQTYQNNPVKGNQASSRNLYLNPDNNIAIQTPAAEPKYKFSQFPETVSRPSRRPLRQAGLLSSAVKGPQIHTGNNEKIPLFDDDWTEEYDGTYWNSLGNNFVPSSLTNTMTILITTIIFLYIS